MVQNVRRRIEHLSKKQDEWLGKKCCPELTSKAPFNSLFLCSPAPLHGCYGGLRQRSTCWRELRQNPIGSPRKTTAALGTGRFQCPGSSPSRQQLQTGKDEDRQEGRLRHNEDDGLAADVEDRAKARLHAHREFVARIGWLASGDGWRRWTTPSVTLDPPCRSRPMLIAGIISRSSGAG